jgi:hypothetical protein
LAVLAAQGDGHPFGADLADVDGEELTGHGAGGEGDAGREAPDADAELGVVGDGGAEVAAAFDAGGRGGGRVGLASCPGRGGGPGLLC